MSRASERAYDKIRQMITSGELAAGSQISEEQLANSCGVSRTPVRDALRRLEGELFITRSDSKRSYVAQWSDDDIDDAFELRAILESHAAHRAAQRITKQQLASLSKFNQRILDAVEGPQPDVPAFLDNNRAFHETIVSAAASDRLAAMLTTVVEQPVVLRTALRYNQKNLLRAYHEHQELITAFETQDSDWAAALMTSHIRRALHAYLDAHDKSDEIHSAIIAA